MDQADFEAVMRHRLIKCEYILAAKSQDYSREQDKLHNFKGVAEMTGETPEKALEGMLLKHVQSIRDIIKDLPGKLPTRETVEEKFTDTINYIILLEALIVERKKGNSQESPNAGKSN